MSAIPATPVLDAGADPAEVEAWVRSALGWLGVWRLPGGAQVACFKDPDGNTLSLTQFRAPTILRRDERR